jgi:hypothetical protein
MTVANTKDCFRECIGKRVVGVLFDALPLNRYSIAGSKTLLFDDGSGLTICSNGAFWLESSENIKRAVEEARAKLLQVQSDLKNVFGYYQG